MGCKPKIIIHSKWLFQFTPRSSNGAAHLMVADSSSGMEEILDRRCPEDGASSCRSEPQNSPLEGFPGTPKIQEVRPESGSKNFGFCTDLCHVPAGDLNPGIRRVSLRAEIDTSPPFGSVREAVTRFGGSGPWVPLYKFDAAYNGIEEFDLKKVEEQAAELEKDLIVKELETLDVLEELGSTKKIVEELKRQLQHEAMKCMNGTSPDSDTVKETNEEHCEHSRFRSSNPGSISSPESILMELKKAKLNLGKTINDLGAIQASVECLNRKMKKEKSLLERTREKLTYKFAGLALKPSNGNFEQSSNISSGTCHNNAKPEQFKQMVDPTRSEVPKPMSMPANEHRKPCIRTAEMRWIAAKKMEEASRAAKALAVIEMKLSILRKLEKASEEVKHSKEALEDALNRVETANRMQFDAKEALRRWIPDQKQRKHVVHNATKIDNFPLPHPHQHQKITRSPLHDLNERNPKTDDEQNPVSRPPVSMEDILSRKQVPTKGPTERQKVALSQMLHELREDQHHHHLAFSPKPDQKDEQKQYLSQRRKFGFIHISLLQKQNKKKPIALNTV
ncbi:LOB domain-containing protein 15-like [Hibiscus syriacus]|uniref:LOB domain-containing protein 15-like n=1 Tax=Hibiscus syriacus TaxID=106335 RepID=A0A6A2WQ08_HIBSY|nr:LOB domain-containing protein 15-like [Hibiscus syriacus]